MCGWGVWNSDGSECGEVKGNEQLRITSYELRIVTNP